MSYTSTLVLLLHLIYLSYLSNVYHACSFFTNLDLFCIDNARVIYRKIWYFKFTMLSCLWSKLKTQYINKFQVCIIGDDNVVNIHWNANFMTYLEKSWVCGKVAWNSGFIFSNKELWCIVIFISNFHSNHEEARSAPSISCHHRNFIQFLGFTIQFLFCYYCSCTMIQLVSIPAELSSITITFHILFKDPNSVQWWLDMKQVTKNMSYVVSHNIVTYE